MFSFRNCENGHSLVISSHLLNPDMRSVIIGTSNQGNKTQSAGGRFEPICARGFPADPAHVSTPDAPGPASPAPSAGLWGHGGRGLGSGWAGDTLSEETVSFYLFANSSVGNICFLFSFFFFSLNHFYKLLKSFSLFSDN